MFLLNQLHLPRTDYCGKAALQPPISVGVKERVTSQHSSPKIEGTWSESFFFLTEESKVVVQRPSVCSGSRGSKENEVQITSNIAMHA